MDLWLSSVNHFSKIFHELVFCGCGRFWWPFIELVQLKWRLEKTKTPHCWHKKKRERKRRNLTSIFIVADSEDKSLGVAKRKGLGLRERAKFANIHKNQKKSVCYFFWFLDSWLFCRQFDQMWTIENNTILFFLWVCFGFWSGKKQSLAQPDWVVLLHKNPFIQTTKLMTLQSPNETKKKPRVHFCLVNENQQFLLPWQGHSRICLERNMCRNTKPNVRVFLLQAASCNEQKERISNIANKKSNRLGLWEYFCVKTKSNGFSPNTKQEKWPLSVCLYWLEFCSLFLWWLEQKFCCWLDEKLSCGKK